MHDHGARYTVHTKLAHLLLILNFAHYRSLEFDFLHKPNTNYSLQIVAARNPFDWHLTQPPNSLCREQVYY